MSSGEKKGWNDLRGLDPAQVCKTAGVEFDKGSCTYMLRSFGTDITASLENEVFSGNSQLSDTILQRLGYFSKLSTIWYLVGFKDVPLSGELINPVNLKGGALFFRGSHTLPLDQLAERYKNDAEKFLRKGFELGAEKLDHGDASIRLYPLPKFPVVLILWEADDEFPERLDILLDSTAEQQLPLDIIWSIAMMSILIMM
jgi:hypothetical protein